MNRSIGKYVLSLISEVRYHNVNLPRIPIALKREWDVNILKLETLENRAIKDVPIYVGDAVMGFYGVDLK